MPKSLEDSEYIGKLPEKLSPDPHPGDTPNIHTADGYHVSRRMINFINLLFENEFDGEKCVVLAGYRTKEPKRKAEKLFGHPYVYKAVLERLAARRDAGAKTVDDVERALWDQAFAEGEGTSHTARVSALNTLARMKGAFTEQREARTVAIFMGDELDDDD